MVARYRTSVNCLDQNSTKSWFGLNSDQSPIFGTNQRLCTLYYLTTWYISCKYTYILPSNIYILSNVLNPALPCLLTRPTHHYCPQLQIHCSLQADILNNFFSASVYWRKCSHISYISPEYPSLCLNTKLYNYQPQYFYLLFVI